MYILTIKYLDAEDQMQVAEVVIETARKAAYLEKYMFEFSVWLMEDDEQLAEYNYELID